MDSVRTIFALNREIILFVYGLVFFVLGLAIALQTRGSSRLDLARSLRWLAAFGLSHGFYEWGDLFIPVQAQYLDPGVIALLQATHLVLLAVSFACLLQFGLSLLGPPERRPWLRFLAAALLAGWLFVIFVPLAARHPEFTAWPAWHNSATALARYAIGFPGALLAAYALRRHTYERIVPLQMPDIVRTLRSAGVLLMLYAVLGGLIPPPAPYFPASVLNEATVEQAIAVPLPVLRSLVGFALTVQIIRALEIFVLETERMIEAMEQSQILAAEHERIGRELHDGAIQSVYSAGLLVEAARRVAEPGSALAGRLDRAVVVLNGAIADLRETLAELRREPQREPLAAGLERLAADPRFRSLVAIDLALDLPEAGALPARRSEHVLAIVREALANAVRHARARQVDIRAARANGRLVLTVQDDGQGLPSDLQAGFGLRNMRDRARLLGGRLDIGPSPGRGTRVTLDIPWEEEPR
jgi:signal transduction histidine kinase